MLYDRQRGCLLGLAIGDALGAAVEFQSPGKFEPVTGYRDGGPHRLKPGEWTDDTSMALALADSIAGSGWNIDDQASRYVQWWQTGKYSVIGHCFDIGNTTVAALHRFQETGDARTSGDASSNASGNGSIRRSADTNLPSLTLPSPLLFRCAGTGEGTVESADRLMRLAPVPIHYSYLFSDRLAELIEKATESSLPTHASPQCLSACVYMTLVLCGLMDGRSREEVLDPEWEPLQRAMELYQFHPEVKEVASGSFRRKNPPDIVGSGYVVESLEAALWAFHDAQDFREAVLKAVNLGGDADTTGAVCGQLAGASWGASGIPSQWLEGLAKREMIEEALAGLTDTINNSDPAPEIKLTSADPPTSRSYWVVEDKLLAGAYPGDLDDERHEAKVQALVSAGIRTFINLTELDEKGRGGQPFKPYEHLAAQLSDGNAVFLRYSIVDRSVPDMSLMDEILVAIDRAIAAGSPVYVHCWGGIGRTGTVIACWLLRHGLAEPDTVFQVLNQLRQKDSERHDWPAPENSDQEQFVLDWFRTR